MSRAKKALTPEEMPKDASSSLFKDRSGPYIEYGLTEGKSYAGYTAEQARESVRQTLEAEAKANG